MKEEFKALIEHLENWCGCSAYGENHPCGEHNCDDSRGRNYSADELLNEVKRYLAERIGFKETSIPLSPLSDEEKQPIPE